MSEIVSSFVEVVLGEADNFLKVKETLGRIGIASRKENKLFQSCHIVHKQGKYYIVHFKELFLLDGKPSDLTENDISRRNTIIKLLEEWELIEIVGEKELNPLAPMNQIKILRFDEKDNWELVTKYNIGRG